jgi:O-methyltransferase
MVDRTIADQVRHAKLTYLSREKFDSLYDCTEFVQQNNILGDFAEFGVALGGSGICLAKSSNGRKYFGFDVFGMIPPPSEEDGSDVKNRYNNIISGKSTGIGGDKYYGYEANLYDKVVSNFAYFGCHVDHEKVFLIEGLFSDTLLQHDKLRFAIAHIDCDWYESVLLCLNYVWQNLSPGGLIILDDYNDWSGCKKATNEFLLTHPSAKLIRSRPHAVLGGPVHKF